jgi:hypothetical protein
MDTMASTPHAFSERQWGASEKSRVASPRQQAAKARRAPSWRHECILFFHRYACRSPWKASKSLRGNIDMAEEGEEEGEDEEGGGREGRL